MPTLRRLIDAAHAAHLAHEAATDNGADPAELARLAADVEATMAAVLAAHPAGVTAVSVELTDAIHDGAGWSANGCWAQRYSLWLPAGCTPSYLSRRIKAAAGLSGLRGETYDGGDFWQFRPYGCAVLCFASFN